MSISTTRADVSHLVFQLYDRSVHPELLQSYAEADYWFDRYGAMLRICEAGHAIAFQYRGRTVTEMVGHSGQPLPQRKRLFDRRLRGCRDEAHRFEGGLNWQASFQLERLEPEVFLNVHEELLADCERSDLAVRFPPANRLSPEPLSLIRAEAGARSLLVHAFHTFPESCAVVRTQSLFEF